MRWWLGEDLQGEDVMKRFKNQRGEAADEVRNYKTKEENNCTLCTETTDKASVNGF